MFYKIILFFLMVHNVQCSKGSVNIGGIFESSELLNRIFLNIKSIHIPTDTSHNLTLMPHVYNDAHPDDPFSATNGTCSLIKQEVVGIVGPGSPTNVDVVASICENKGIPHILTNRVPPGSMGLLSLNLYPNPERLSEAYFDIIKFLEWKGLTVIYTDPDSLLWISHILEWATDEDIAIQVQNIDPEHKHDYVPMLKELRDSGQKTFFLDCTREELSNILKQIQQVGMMTNEYSYFLANLDAHTEEFGPFLFSDATIIGVNIVSTENNQQQVVTGELCRVLKEDYCSADLTNVPPKLDLNSALLMDAISVFTFGVWTANITEGKNLSCQDTNMWYDGVLIVDTIKNYTHTGLTGMISFDANGYRDFFQLTIFQIKQELVEIGTWISTREIMSNEIDVPEEISEENFRDKEQIVEIILNPPYAMLAESEYPLEGNYRYEGFVVDLIEEIANMENFDYKLIASVNGNRGSFDPSTGSWNGMIGDVVNGTADMALGDLTITQSRLDAVDFTIPFMTLGISILYKKPSLEPPQFFTFADPFPLDFWILLAQSYAAVVFSLFVIGRITPGEWRKPRGCKDEGYLENQLTFFNCLWFTAGSLFKQNTRVRINSLPARIVSAAWWLFCFVVVAMYIGLSMSRTTVPQFNRPFHDVMELVEKSESQGIRFGALKGGSTAYFFKGNSNPIYQKIWDHMKNHPEDMVTSTHEGIEKAENENYAFFMESTTIEYTIQEHCSLDMYGGLLDSKGFAIAVRKDSPTLRKVLSQAILKLQSSGKLVALKNKWWFERNENMCQYDSESDVSSLSLLDVNGLMWITLVGAIIATFIAMMEFCTNVNRLSNKSEKSFCKCLSQEIGSCFRRRKTYIVRAVNPDEAQSKTPETVELQ